MERKRERAVLNRRVEASYIPTAKAGSQAKDPDP